MKMDANNEVVDDSVSTMGVPYVTSFCCCMGLETGTKLVGYLHMIAAVCFTIVCSLFTAGAHQNAGTIEDAGDRLYSTWFTIGLVVSIVSVGHVLLALLLLVAAYKRNRLMVRVWVAVMSLLAAAALLYTAVAAALGLRGSGSDIFLAFAEEVVFFGVVIYCIVVVNSYNMMLRSTEDMESPPPKIDY